MPRIVLQRAAVGESMNYTNSEDVLVGPYGETYPACYDTNQALNIKAEEVSDVEEEEDSVPKNIQEIKAEPENYTNSEDVLVGPYGETYPACYDANQALNIKAEEISDAEEEEDPVPKTIQEIKAETEILRPVVHWNRIRPSKWSPVYGRIRPTDPMICKGIGTRPLHMTYSAECNRTRPNDGQIPFKWDQSYVFGRVNTCKEKSLMDSEKLISFVHENTPLWDMRDKQYHHRDVQRKLWSRVAEEMGVEVALVKKKWQGLRDVFRKEYNRSLQGRSGDEAPLECISSWPHFQTLLFLKGTIEHRKLQGNISPSKNTGSRTAESGCISDTSHDSYIDNEYAPLEHSAHGSQESTDGSQSWTASETMDPPPTPNVTKKRKLRSNTSADPFLQIEKEKLKLFAGNAAAKEDSDYQFLMSLLPFLRNTPFHRKLIVRHKLQQVFIEEEQNASKPANSESLNQTEREPMQTVAS